MTTLAHGPDPPPRGKHAAGGAPSTPPTGSFGVGAYRDENGDVELGFNAGTGLAVCLGRRLSFVSRYDYHSVDAFSRDYSTVQVGLRLHF